MFCCTSLTESSTNSWTMSCQIVRNTKHNLLLGSNISGKKLGGGPRGEGGSYSPEEKFTHFHCQNSAGLVHIDTRMTSLA